MLRVSPLRLAGRRSDRRFDRLPVRTLRTLRVFALLVALAWLLAACGEAADLIPGDASDHPSEGEAAIDAPDDGDDEPLIAPGALGDAAAGGDAGPRIPDADLARSVVQIATVNNGLPARNGSGVVIDTERGLILTSAELVHPFRADGTSAHTAIHVGANRTPGQDPRSEYAAEITAIDSAAGIAVLRVTGAAGGGQLAAGDFDLPQVTVGDPLVLQRTDALRLFGHPGFGTEQTPQAVTVTKATVAGFRGDRTAARRWMLTDARIPWGAAGGPAFDHRGALVGVLAQIAYDPAAPVGQVRPIHHAQELIAAAMRGASVDHSALLHHPAPVPGSSAPSATDGAFLTQPSFAENAVDGSGGRDLFDYASVMPAGVTELYYEFSAQGVPDGAPVQELWYLDGVLQDGVSSSYTWSFGSLATVSDRLGSPAAQGIPSGRWRLEVWINGTMRSAGSVYIGVQPTAPSVDTVRLSTVAGPDQQPGGPAFSGSPRLLGFFEYRGAALAETIRWIVFHEGRLVYQSPAVPWLGGENGTWWVGHLDDAGIPAGTWEIEVYFDNRVAGSGSVVVF